MQQLVLIPVAPFCCRRLCQLLQPALFPLHDRRRLVQDALLLCCFSSLVRLQGTENNIVLDQLHNRCTCDRHMTHMRCLARQRCNADNQQLVWNVQNPTLQVTQPSASARLTQGNWRGLLTSASSAGMMPPRCTISRRTSAGDMSGVTSSSSGIASTCRHASWSSCDKGGIQNHECADSATSTDSSGITSTCRHTSCWSCTAQGEGTRIFCPDDAMQSLQVQ